MSTIHDLILRQAKRVPDQLSIVWEDGQLSYSELCELTLTIGHCIFMNLPKQETVTTSRIGLVHPNGPGFSALLLSASVVGTVAPMSPCLSRAEYQKYYEQINISLLLLPAEGMTLAEEAAQSLGINILRLSWLDFKSTSRNLPKLEKKITRGEDTALILLTSGSTGLPKAVPLTHINISHATRSVAHSLKLTQDDRCLCMWEQYHIGGLVDLLLAPIYAASSVIITEGFNTQRFFRHCRKFRPTWFQGVPTTLGEILKVAKATSQDESINSFRVIRSVAAPISNDVQMALEELFKCPVLQTFGMTEAAPLITSTELPPARRKYGSVGKPCDTEVKIFARHLRQDGNEEGEIAVKGVNVFNGYENDEETNSKQFIDGWFLTGDLGYFDHDGDLFITGRVKQLVNRGGEKINPQEVDNRLNNHPEVLRATCFPLAHPTLGEQLAAAVIPSDKENPPTVSTLRRWVQTELAAFKVPSKFFFVSTFPLTDIGKIDRNATARMCSNLKGEGELEPPRNEIEQVIHKLWLQELDLQTLGVSQDFIAVGGDSLSSARLIIAIEKSFNVTIPDSVVDDCITVAATALVVDKLLSTSKKELPSTNTRLERGLTATIGSGASKGSFKPIDPEKVNELAKIKNAAHFKLAADKMILDSTPGEIANLMKQSQNIINSSPSASSNLFKKFYLSLQENVHRFNQSSNWNRQNLAENLLFYASDDGVDDRLIVVAFTGMARRLMLPTPFFLGSMPAGVDIVIVKDLNRDHYRNGIAGFGHDLRSSFSTLAKSIQSLISSYKEIMTFGTSSGGLPALAFASFIDTYRAVAVGPDNINRQDHFDTFLSELKLEGRREGLREVIHFSGGCERDVQSGKELTRVLVRPQLIAHPKYQHHNLIHELHTDGALEDWCAQVFAISKKSV